MLVKRNSMKEKDVIEKSVKIGRKLKAMKEFKRAKTIAFYIGFKNEPQTLHLIKQFIGSKNILVPFTDTKNKKIILSELRDLDELEEATYGILQPKRIREVYPHDVDLIVIPGIAFDGKGNRVGFGFAYYDKLLPQIPSPKVALAYDFQILDKVPHDQTDYPVDKIVTETRIVECKKQ